MKIKVKKLHPEAKLPARGSEEAAGYDLYAVSLTDLGVMLRCHTGIAIEIPRGYVGLIFPRSSIVKKAMRLANSVGVIDSDYRGEITFMFDKTGSHFKDLEPHYDLGEKIGQLLVIKHEELDLEEVSELNQTQRGTGGYGSTGK